MRVIAGDVAGHAGPGSTYSPMTLVHATLSPGARLSLPWRRRLQRPRLRPWPGRGASAPKGDRSARASWPCSGPGNALTVAAAPIQESRSPNLDVLVLGGRPIREPVAWMGPFVMNTREEVMQAFADYQAGRLGSIPAVHNAPTTLIQTDRPRRGQGDPA